MRKLFAALIPSLVSDVYGRKRLVPLWCGRSAGGVSMSAGGVSSS